MFALVLHLWGCKQHLPEESDNKKGVKIGVSKYSPFGVGEKRIYEQAVFVPEEWAYLRPFFTRKKEDGERFARTRNSKEEIVYKVEKNIQGYCVYTTNKPGIECDYYNDLSFFVSKNGRDWRAVATTLDEKKRGIYVVTQPNDPEWVNVQHFVFKDMGGSYLKIQWNNEENHMDSPQINRVEINYADSPYDGWKNMLIDECLDFSETYDHSEHIQVASGSPSNHRSVIVYADEDVLEQEIKYAVEGGVDYFIWLMAEKTSSHSWSIEQYLSIPNYQDIGFCVELHLSNELPDSGEPFLNETWEEYCHRLVRYFSEPNYVTVLDNRPLVYTICNVSDADVKKLRKIALEAGFNDPYIVDAYWGKPGTPMADARSEYNGTNGFIADIWDYYGNQDQLRIVPNFGTGMNDVCRTPNPPPWGNWGVDKPFLKPNEIRQGLQEALDYVVENPEICEAGILTVFDWDSQTEAGWICPGLAENGSVKKERLEIFKEVLVSGEPVQYERKRIEMGENLVFNPGFEVNQTRRHRPVGWHTDIDETADPNMIYAFVSVEGGYQSDHCGIISSGSDYKVTAFQDISEIAEGVFTLSATIKCSGSQDTLQMFISGQGGEQLVFDIDKTDDWTKISIEGIPIISGHCRIGFYSDAPANEWLLFDDIELVLSGSS